MDSISCVWLVDIWSGRLLSFYHANFAISATGTEKVFALEWALHHITTYPIDQFRDCLLPTRPIFLCVSIPPDQILATSSSLCNVTVSNLLHFFISVLKLLFFSKGGDYPLFLLPFSLFFLLFLLEWFFLFFLFARNCDALPHTRTNRPCQLVTFPRTIWNRAEFQ